MGLFWYIFLTLFNSLPVLKPHTDWRCNKDISLHPARNLKLKKKISLLLVPLDYCGLLSSLNPSVATVSSSFFWFDMHGSRRMKPADFGDPLTFPLTPQRGWHLWFSLYHKCQLSDGLPWHFPEIFQVCRGYSVTTLMIPSLYTVLWVRSRWLRKRWQKKPINYSFFFLMHGVKKLVWQAKVYLLMNNNDFSFEPAML